jgi:hypothetical protein
MKCCLHPHILRTNIFLFDHWTESVCNWIMQFYKSYTAISNKFVPEQSGKVEYVRERLAGNR